MSVYNQTRHTARIEDLEPPACRESNGDLLLHHLVFRRLTGASRALNVEAGHHWGCWYGNPLNALCHVTSIRDPKTATPDWDRLAEPDLAAFLPWIGARIGGDWRSPREALRSDLDAAAGWFGGLAALLGAWIESASGRPDLLVFLLEVFKTEAESAHGDLNRFEESARPLNRKEREQLSGPWADFLKTAEALRGDSPRLRRASSDRAHRRRKLFPGGLGGDGVFQIRR